VLVACVRLMHKHNTQPPRRVVCSPAVKGASGRLMDGSGGSRDGGRDVARWTVEEAS
jgi:hypothetical protein